MKWKKEFWGLIIKYRIQSWMGTTKLIFLPSNTILATVIQRCGLICLTRINMNDNEKLEIYF